MFDDPYLKYSRAKLDIAFGNSELVIHYVDVKFLYGLLDKELPNLYNLGELMEDHLEFCLEFYTYD